MTLLKKHAYVPTSIGAGYLYHGIDGSVFVILFFLASIFIICLLELTHWMTHS